MEYYCIMVMTGEEESFKKKALEALNEKSPESKFFFFKRKLYTPKREYFIAPLFPGYVFFETEKLDAEIFSILKKVDGFCRILPENLAPEKISGNALDELKLFMHNGEEWGISKIKFLEGQRIKAIFGPLVGLEGRILRVNKKKGQITVSSSLTCDGKRIDLLFEQAEVVE